MLIILKNVTISFHRPMSKKTHKIQLNMSAVSIDESYDIYAIFKQKYDLQNPSKFLTQS